jgi:hypothetical protein
MVKHADSWFSFARQLDLGIENMEEIILVTGCDRTVSWANVTFFGTQEDAQASFGVKHFHGDDPGNNVIQFSREPVEGAVLNHGPEGAVRLAPGVFFARAHVSKIALVISTYPKIKPYSSEGFVLLGSPRYYQGIRYLQSRL